MDPSLDEDHELELTPPEGTFDVHLPPSKLGIPRLEDKPVEGPEDAALYETPKQEKTPAQAVADIVKVPAAAAPANDSYSTSFSKEDIRAAIDTIKNAFGKASARDEKPTLVSTAPSWYQGGPPPKHSWAADLVKALGGAMAAQSQAAMQNPLRPLDMKMEDARNGALASGLSGLLGGALDKKRQQYDENLDAARAEASMTHPMQLKSGKDVQIENAKALLNFAHQERLQESLDKMRDANEARLADLNDPNSPSVKAAEAALVAQGIAKQEDFPEGMTLAMLQKQYPMFNAAFQQQGRATQHEVDDYNMERRRIMASNLSKQEKVQQLANLDRQHAAQSYVDDDVVWKGGNAPDSHAVNVVRKVQATKNTMLRQLGEMQQIQDELNQMGHGFTGTFDEWLGRFEGTPEGTRAQQLITQARQISNELMVEQRDRFDMGVPQEWEQKLVRSLVPQAGSLAGWLKGSFEWSALAQEIDRQAYNKIRSYGGGLKSRGDTPGAGPSYQTGEAPLPPMKRVHDRQVENVPDAETPAGDDTGDEPTPGMDKLPVSNAPAPAIPQAAKAPAQTAPKTYRITGPDGKTFERALTPEQVTAAKQHGFQVQ